MVFRSGEMVFPSGGRIFPSGKLIFPSGELIFPSGELLFPSGEAVFPSGELVFPSGGPIFPSGGRIFPSGELIFPSGEAVFPSGGPIFPSGELLFPSGEAVFPSGELIFPSGELIFRSGEAIFPSGVRIGFSFLNKNFFRKRQYRYTMNSGGNLMFNVVVLWGSFIIPWLSLLLLNGDVIRRYMPVAIFGSLLVSIQNELAYTYEWWVVKETLFPQIITYVPFVFGAFLIGTIWIFHLTGWNFWLFMLANVVMDLIFAFPLNNWIQSLGLYELVNYTNWDVFYTFIFIAMLLYVYQKWQEKIMVPKSESPVKFQ
ncbi:hypothetical protein [Texcoconibacillus texcoconensis]|uniref:Uncharacterized protein n=1 Tax=Texcoconibacillus texcoconensis TaxID=1095777 RepID=A0A840QTH1_9BACI|nr:hypothetical protein [Texcoconibacillus texcoconensis]MBB5174599.1 hypothetical protein [Texcoconibacillus texcoconensis]